MPAIPGDIRGTHTKPKPAKAKKSYGLGKAPAFQSPTKITAPFAPTQKQAAAKTRTARKALPKAATPAIPVLKHPTDAQRAEAVDLLLHSHPLNGHLATTHGKVITPHGVTDAKKYGILDDAKGGLGSLLTGGLGSSGQLTPGTIEAPHGGLLTGLAKAVTAIPRTAAAAAVAEYHDPIGFPEKTVKGGVQILKAVPSGVVNTVLHPEDTLKAAVKDYSHRYGQDFTDQVKRLREHGAAPEVADALALAAGGEATLGRLGVRIGERKGAALVTRARPALRVSGGIVKEQELAPGLGKILVQRGLDRARQAKVTRAGRELEKDLPKGQDAVVVQALKDGHVVRLRPAGLDRTLARSVAKTKSRAVLRLRGEQVRRVDQAARKALARLNKHEQRAYYYVAAGIAPAERDGFTAALRKRMDDIQAARVDHGEPEGLLKRTDELRNIPKIDASKIDFAKLRDVHQELRADAVRIGMDDPALNAAQRLTRRYSQQAETLNIHRGDVEHPASGGVPAMVHGDESLSSYIKRVRAAADKAGLERPVYFPSERYDLSLNPDFASRAAGGMRAAALPRRYTGSNFRLGIQDTSPETFLTGLARNIKRKHNWRLVADLAEQHALGGVTGTAQLVRESMARAGAGPSSYRLWNPSIFRGELGRLERDSEAPSLEAADIHPESAVKDALDLSRRADQPEYANRSGWIAVPTKAFKEIEDSTKPSGALGRSYDIFKGKNSRVLLGAGNIPWLQFQVASNGLLSAFATKGVPPLIAARRWYGKLAPEVRDEVDALLGSSAHADAHQPHLGAASANLLPGVKQMVAGYQAVRSLPVWDKRAFGRGPSLRDLNPIEAMFHADHAQTAWFKKAVLYDQVRRDAFKRMGDHLNVAQRFQAKVVPSLMKAPEEAMRQIVADRHLLEHHAETVNSWLGDYTTYTAAERKVLNRSVMFYGYLRYSLKFAFYTMPFKHPATAAIVGKLGQLQADEIKKLLGGDNLPWAFGKLYIDDNGKLKEVDLTRANPALNTATDLVSGHPESWVSAAPPVLVSLAEQLPGLQRRIYFDRPWRVDGAAAGFNPKFTDYSLTDRARILTDETLGMFAPYRIGEKLTQSGPQGDDSLLWSQRPTVYKRPDIVKSINAQNQRDSASESLLHELVPMLPRPTSDKEISLERDLADQAAAQPPAKKSSSHRSYFGSGGSSGGSSHHYFGTGG